MRSMQSMGAMLAIGCSVAASAADFTDSWRDPADPGWGLSLVQDQATLTVGLFVHDSQGQPRWYSGALREAEGGADYRGDLFEVTRTGGAQQTVRVGELSFQPGSDGRAEVDYRIGTAERHAQVQRLAFAQDRLEGLFFAAMLPGYDGCPQDFHGLRVFESGVMSVERCDGTACVNDPPATRDRTPIHMIFADGTQNICSIDGSFTRYGTSGGMRGTYQCSDGGAGNIEMKDIEFTSVGFQARFTAQHPQCREFRGILTGMRADAR
jgi:hypothetical protein